MCATGGTTSSSRATDVFADEGANRQGTAPGSKVEDRRSNDWTRIIGISLGVFITLVVLGLLVVVLIERSTAGDAEPTLCAEELQDGCKGPNVQTLEQHLKAAKLLDAEPDDTFDGTTGEAVYALEACEGELNPTEKLALTSKESAHIVQNAPPEPLGFFPCAAPADVKPLQQALKSAGYGDLKVDGLFGPHTEAALRLFEADIGPPQDVDGRIAVGGLEWSKLKAQADGGHKAVLTADNGGTCRKPADKVVFTFGCSDDAVDALETHLGEIGLMPASHDTRLRTRRLPRAAGGAAMPQASPRRGDRGRRRRLERHYGNDGRVGR